MIEDAELLRRYTAERSQTAFAELVQRHLGLVYSVALRQVERDAHLAEDVAQKVFSDLARKAGPLSRHPVLTGWLYRSTQFTAIDVMRAERRRRAREQEAQIMHELSTEPERKIDADKLRPVLDQVMGELNDPDRDAVMLRFFESRPFAEIGAKLRLTEDAARMRVDRALEKMRALLVRRGVSSTSAVLAGLLASQGGVAAPAGLATALTGGALMGASATTAIVTFMSMTKLQIVAAGALVVAGATGIAVQEKTNAGLAAEIAPWQAVNDEITHLQDENRRLAGIAREAESYRNDAVELARLKDEAGALAERARAAERRAAQAAQTAAATANATRIYDLSEVDQIPVAISQGARPVYPFALRRAGITGQAHVSFVVGADGVLQDIHGVSATHPEFEAAAIEVVKKWKFSVGQKGGVPVGVRMQVPIVFSINEKNDPSPGGAGP